MSAPAYAASTATTAQLADHADIEAAASVVRRATMSSSHGHQYPTNNNNNHNIHAFHPMASTAPSSSTGSPIVVPLQRLAMTPDGSSQFPPQSSFASASPGPYHHGNTIHHTSTNNNLTTNNINNNNNNNTGYSHYNTVGGAASSPFSANYNTNANTFLGNDLSQINANSFLQRQALDLSGNNNNADNTLLTVPTKTEHDHRQLSDSLQADMMLATYTPVAPVNEYRILPLLIGCIIPISILINVPSLTSDWVGIYATDPKTGIETLRVIPMPTWLDATVITALVMAILCNICVLVRFLERQVYWSTILGLIAATLQDLLCLAAMIPFLVNFPPNHGYAYLEGFWTMVASMIFSFTATVLMSIDLHRTPHFREKGSGVTHKQRLLIAEAMSLCFYLAVGALIFNFLEGWEFLDSLFFVMVTITTIGFGDHVPVTTGGRVFLVFYASGGIILLAMAVNAIRYVILEDLHQRFAIRARERKAKREQRKRERDERRQEQARLMKEYMEAKQREEDEAAAAALEAEEMSRLQDENTDTESNQDGHHHHHHHSHSSHHKHHKSHYFHRHSSHHSHDEDQQRSQSPPTKSKPLDDSSPETDSLSVNTKDSRFHQLFAPYFARRQSSTPSPGPDHATTQLSQRLPLKTYLNHYSHIHYRSGSFSSAVTVDGSGLGLLNRSGGRAGSSGNDQRPRIPNSSSVTSKLFFQDPKSEPTSPTTLDNDGDDEDDDNRGKKLPTKKKSHGGDSSDTLLAIESLDNGTPTISQSNSSATKGFLDVNDNYTGDKSKRNHAKRNSSRSSSSSSSVSGVSTNTTNSPQNNNDNDNDNNLLGIVSKDLDPSNNSTVSGMSIRFAPHDSPQAMRRNLQKLAMTPATKDTLDLNNNKSNMETKNEIDNENTTHLLTTGQVSQGGGGGDQDPSAQDLELLALDNAFMTRATISLEEQAAIDNIQADKESMQEYKRRLRVSAITFAFFWLAGAVLFYLLESWSFGVSVYFIFVAFSTIGYGDFVPETIVGRSIFLAYCLIGVVALTSLAALISEVLSKTMRKHVVETQMRRLTRMPTSRLTRQQTMMNQNGMDEEHGNMYANLNAGTRQSLGMDLSGHFVLQGVRGENYEGGGTGPGNDPQIVAIAAAAAAAAGHTTNATTATGTGSGVGGGASGNTSSITEEECRVKKNEGALREMIKAAKDFDILIRKIMISHDPKGKRCKDCVDAKGKLQAPPNPLTIDTQLPISTRQQDVLDAETGSCSTPYHPAGQPSIVVSDLSSPYGDGRRGRTSEDDYNDGHWPKARGSANAAGSVFGIFPSSPKPISHPPSPMPSPLSAAADSNNNLNDSHQHHSHTLAATATATAATAPVPSKDNQTVTISRMDWEKLQEYSRQYSLMLKKCEDTLTYVNRWEKTEKQRIQNQAKVKKQQQQLLEARRLRVAELGGIHGGMDDEIRDEEELEVLEDNINGIGSGANERDLMNIIENDLAREMVLKNLLGDRAVMATTTPTTGATSAPNSAKNSAPTSPQALRGGGGMAAAAAAIAAKNRATTSAVAALGSGESEGGVAVGGRRENAHHTRSTSIQLSSTPRRSLTKGMSFHNLVTGSKSKGGNAREDQAGA